MAEGHDDSLGGLEAYIVKPARGADAQDAADGAYGQGLVLNPEKATDRDEFLGREAFTNSPGGMNVIVAGAGVQQRNTSGLPASGASSEGQHVIWTVQNRLRS